MVKMPPLRGSLRGSSRFHFQGPRRPIFSRISGRVRGSFAVLASRSSRSSGGRVSRGLRGSFVVLRSPPHTPLWRNARRLGRAQRLESVSRAKARPLHGRHLGAGLVSSSPAQDRDGRGAPEGAELGKRDAPHHATPNTLTSRRRAFQGFRHAPRDQGGLSETYRRGVPGPAWAPWRDFFGLGRKSNGRRRPFEIIKRFGEIIKAEPSQVNDRDETKHGAAERMRRLRERRRRGTRVFRIEADEAEIEALLVGTKHLSPLNADSPRAVESALQSLIDRLAVSYLSRE
jgi:hypothetical protein